MILSNLVSQEERNTLKNRIEFSNKGKNLSLGRITNCKNKEQRTLNYIMV